MCVVVLAVSLQMKVTGKNLLNVCKLLFALGKNEANDSIFLDEHISGSFIPCSTSTFFLGVVPDFP